MQADELVREPITSISEGHTCSQLLHNIRLLDTSENVISVMITYIMKTTTELQSGLQLA